MISWEEASRNAGVPRQRLLPRSTGPDPAPERWLLRQVTARFGEDLSPRILAIWGANGARDTAEPGGCWDSDVLHALLERGAKLKVHGAEPATLSDQRFHPQVTFSEAGYQCLIGADALLVQEDHFLYRRPDFHRVMVLLQSPVVFDAPALYSPERMRELGFEHYAPRGGRPGASDDARAEATDATPRGGAGGRKDERVGKKAGESMGPVLPSVATKFGIRTLP